MSINRYFINMFYTLATAENTLHYTIMMLGINTFSGSGKDYFQAITRCHKTALKLRQRYEMYTGLVTLYYN